MPYKRILTVQDISCVGQCSMTVALPILSACAIETCVLPSAVLSTHTGGFTGCTVRDLSEDIPAIWRHWQKEGIAFDAVYSGYLGGTRQIEMVKDIFSNLLCAGGIRVVDPAMADNGKLYKGFDEAYANAMKGLCACADIIIPNITEGCILTGHPYREQYDEAYISELLSKLSGLGASCVVLTGVSFCPEETGVMILKNGKASYYGHKRIARSYHGTGDIFASAFVGSCMQDRPPEQAAKIAADFTAECIQRTYDDPAHWYGVKFETALPSLIKMLNLS